MNAVGIDVSKGKSMVAIMRPFGEIVSTPFEIKHTSSDINSLVKLIKSIEEMCIRDRCSGVWIRIFAGRQHRPCGMMTRISSGKAKHGQRENISFQKKIKMPCGWESCF